MKIPPHGWALDTITQYLDTARENAFAAFANWKAEFSNLLEIDDLFREALKAPGANEEVPALFVFRSHGAFLAAMPLALGGAVADLPMLLRGSLEYALYGLHVHRNPRAAEIWLRRADSPDARRATRKEFTVRKLWDTLKAADSETYRFAQEAYDESIDHGAHPNIGALATTVSITPSEDATHIEHVYLAADTLSRVSCCTMASKTGYTSLRVLQVAFPNAFAELGITRRLEIVRSTIIKTSRARMSEAGYQIPAQAQGVQWDAGDAHDGK